MLLESITAHPSIVYDIRNVVPIPFDLACSYTNFKCAVDLAILHQVSSHDALIIVTLIHIFGKIESNPP